MNEYITEFINTYGNLLIEGFRDTLLMTFFSTAIAYCFGLPIGVLAEVTTRDGINPKPTLNRILQIIINIGRSIPFILLLVALIPFTRLVTGTTLGPVAAVVPLTISAIPFIARLVENSLKELDKGVIEAARAMGATNWQIVFKIMLPECLPSLISGLSMAIITIIGYTAMAGAVGAGGLGDIAIRYGYHRHKLDVAIITIIILVILVQLIQSSAHFMIYKIDKRGKGEL